MPPIRISPISPSNAAEQDAAEPLQAAGHAPEEGTLPAGENDENTQTPPLTALDGGYAGLPQRPGQAPVALAQMGPSALNKTNVPMMVQGGVFVLLPLFFANNPAMFQQNRMFIWILFALGCGLIASQVPGVDNLNLPKIKLFGLEFAARGWVAVSIIVVMALVNPTKPLLDVVSSAINNNKPVTSTPVEVAPNAKTGNLQEVVAPETPAKTQVNPAPLPATKPLVIASAGAVDTAKPAAEADAPNPMLMNSFTSLKAEPGEAASVVGVSARQDVTTLQKISYKDRIILPTVQWQAMGIELKPGDILSINNVRGSWTLSDPAHDNAPMVDADGGALALVSAKVRNKPATPFQGSFMMPNAPPAALIGKIGLNGQPFVVGKRLASTPIIEGGELYLSINDASTIGTPGFWDNAGQMQANIHVLTAANLE